MAIEKIAIKITGNTKEIEKQLAGIEAKLKKLQKSKAQFQLKTDELEAARKSIDSIDLTIQRLQAQKVTLQIEYQESRKAGQELDNLQQKLSNVNQASGKAGGEDAETGSIKGLDLVNGVAKTIQESAQALKDIDAKVPGDLSTLMPKLANMGIAIGGMGVLVAIAGALAEKFTKQADKGLEIISSISENLQKAAEAMKQVDEKVPEGMKSFGKKLINMGIAIAGMGALAAVAGVLAEKFTKQADKGLEVVSLISVNLMIAAEAMKQVDEKVPEGIISVGKKLANMAIAIGVMGVLTVAAGVLAEKFTGQAVAGLLAVAGISVDLMLAAEAMKQIDEKVPEDIVSVGKKLANMAIAIGAMGAIVTAVGLLVSTGLGALVAGAGLATVALVAVDMILVAEAIGQLNEKVPSDLSETKAKIDSIAEVIGYFTESSLGTVSELFDNFVKTLNVAVVAQGITAMTSLVEELEKFDQVEIPQNIEEKIQEIQDVIELFDGATLMELIESALGVLEVAVVKEGFGFFVEIGEYLEEIGKLRFSSELVKSKLQKIQEMIDFIAGEKEGIFSKIKSLIGKTIDSAMLETAADSFSQLNAIGIKLMLLESITFDENEVKKKVNIINDIVEMLADGDIVALFKSVVKKGEIEVVKTSLDGMIKLCITFQELLQEEFSYLDIYQRIWQINSAIRQIGGSTVSELFASVVKKAELEQADESIKKLIDIAGNLHALQQVTFDHEEIIEQIGYIKAILQEMSELPVIADAGVMEEMVNVFLNLIIQLKALAEEFVNVGKQYGENVIKGFLEARVIEGIVKVIQELITALIAKKERFTEIGRKYGQALKTAFVNAINNMHEKLDSQITKMMTYTIQFGILGSLLGKSFVSAFNTAMEGLSTEVEKRVNKMQKLVTNMIALSTIIKPEGYANGGKVTEYHAGGGIAGIFKPKGTDTVPAMLTPGEFVQNKNAVSKFGLNFMNRVNSLDVQGAFNAMARRFNTHTMMTPAVATSVNNINNMSSVNNARVTQHISSGNPDYSMRRAGKYLRTRL